MLGRHRRNHSLGALTNCDRDVLAQMAAGVTNRAIARRMFLFERAIERHVTAIFANSAWPRPDTTTAACSPCSHTFAPHEK